MFIKHGSTRTVVCFPLLGIVVKFPRSCLGDFGIKANKAEAYLWKKTRNPLLAPVLLSLFGWVVIMHYYPKEVKKGISHNGLITDEVLDAIRKHQCFRSITEKILGIGINCLLEDKHDTKPENFRLTKNGKLVMVDYGISPLPHQKVFVKFLDEHGTKLVAEYAEPPQ